MNFLLFLSLLSAFEICGFFPFPFGLHVAFARCATFLWDPFRFGLLIRYVLDHVLLSHDAGWYSVGEPRGGNVRGFDTLFTKFLTALKTAGLSEDDIKQLIVTNPAKAFVIGVRSLVPKGTSTCG